MCNNVIVFVIDSTYSNERKLIGVLTVLGEETFNVPVDENEMWLQFMSGVDNGSHFLNQVTGGDLDVNTNSRYIPLQLRHLRFGQQVSQ